MDQFTNPYEQRLTQRDNNIFTEEFLSGMDVDIYIDDQKINSIASIMYTLQEQQKPIYGYASRTYDDVAVGSRIVTGVIRVPVSTPNENPITAYISSNNYKNSKSTNTTEETQNTAPSWVLNTQRKKVE